MRKIAICLVLTIVLCGCMIGPDYKRPAVEMPASWHFEEKEAKQIGNTAWWEQFGDPVLNDLVQAALAENKDIMIATARVEEFAGQYAIARAALFPQASAGAITGRTRQSDNSATPLTSATINPADIYSPFLTASWQIDFWGQLRRATEASRADLLSLEESRRVVIITLVTSVASAYVNLRHLDTQLDIARRTAQSRKESYDLFQLRFEGGVISDLELSQVKSQYEQALSTIPFLEKAIAQQENALSVLLGRNPGPIPRGKKIDDLVLPAVPAGLPSELLANRPDIRQAEQALVAANARIGVARSLYFPTISLTGMYGFASTDLSTLFQGPSRVWNWAIPVNVPIFTGGAIGGQVKSAEARQRQALIRYQQSIQTAFREVDDALIDQKRSREELEIQNRQLESLGTYATTARLRFDNGYTSYIEVLDAERSLFAAELGRAQTKGVLFQALVTLYKAMGGGWVIEADKRITAVSDKKETQSLNEESGNTH